MTNEEYVKSLETGGETTKVRTGNVTIPISRFDQLVTAETALSLLHDLCAHLDEYDFRKAAVVILGTKEAPENA